MIWVNFLRALNYVSDALSRMYEDETDVELASMEIAEETTDTWYKRMFASVAANPIDHPYRKIVHGRLYIYRPNPMIEDLMEEKDAWKLVSPAEKRESARKSCRANRGTFGLRENARAFITILLLAVHAQGNC